jgi:hypothetical protein
VLSEDEADTMSLSWLNGNETLLNAVT